MMKNDSVKNLVKILIGTAWLDGKIQPDEQKYLNQVAVEKGVSCYASKFNKWHYLCF